MARILVLCPSHRDHRELARAFAPGEHEFAFHDYASLELEELLAPWQCAHRPHDVTAEVEALVARYRGRIDAVASSDDYPGSSLASIVAARLNLPGTPPRANLVCQHKYHARLAQREAGVDGTPDFELVRSASAATLGLPCFVKPVKSFFSIGAGRARSRSELARRVDAATLPDAFFAPFRALFEAHTGMPFPRGTVLLESLLHGRQVTVEGFVHAGAVTVLGVVDSLFHPGSLAFRRFEYPSALPAPVQQRMAAVARDCMHATGFAHGLFNVEMTYDAAGDGVHVIEINPRMASQFADLYEKVDGVNTYRVLVDLALGRAPRVARGQGRHRIAASHVMRRFSDAFVAAVPGDAEVRRFLERHPDARVEILAGAGRFLSQDLQDGESFRYGIVNVGAADRDALEAAIDDAERLLPFDFEARAVRTAPVPAASGSGS